MGGRHLNSTTHKDRLSYKSVGLEKTKPSVTAVWEPHKLLTTALRAAVTGKSPNNQDTHPTPLLGLADIQHLTAQRGNNSTWR